jgi:hypothetical protein
MSGWKMTPRHVEKGAATSALIKSNGYNRVTLPTLSILGNEPVVWISDKAELRVGGKVVNTRRH